MLERQSLLKSQNVAGLLFVFTWIDEVRLYDRCALPN
jgi:hypothetical protein